MPRGGDTACAASLLSSRECASLTRTATGGVVVLLDNSTQPPREFVDASLGALRAHPSEPIHASPTDQLPAAVINATVLLPSALHVATKAVRRKVCCAARAARTAAAPSSAPAS